MTPELMKAIIFEIAINEDHNSDLVIWVGPNEYNILSKILPIDEIFFDDAFSSTGYMKDLRLWKYYLRHIERNDTMPAGIIRIFPKTHHNNTKGLARRLKDFE